MKLQLAAVMAACLLATTAADAAEPPSGVALYLNHCAACHGSDGEGGGPVAAVMDITVPNLRSLTLRNRGTFPANTVMAYIDGREMKAAHGDRQMPIWGDVFSAQREDGDAVARSRIAAIVAFIAQLQYR